MLLLGARPSSNSAHNAMLRTASARGTLDERPPDIIMQYLDDILKHLKSWLEAHKVNQENQASVQQIYDFFTWEAANYETFPIKYHSHNELVDKFKQIKDQLPTYMPIPQNPNPLFITQMSAVSSSSSVFTGINNATILSSDISVWFNSRLQEKESLDETYKIKSKVKDFLAKIDNTLVEEFNDVENNFLQYRDEPTKHYFIGISMRNLWEHLFGKLWAKYKKPFDQKYKIEILYDYILESSSKPLITSLITEAKRKYDYIHGVLSDIAKKQTKASLDIRLLYNEYYSFLFSILVNCAI